MIQASSYVNPVKRSPFWLRAVFAYCLVALTSFIVVSVQAVETAKSNQAPEELSFVSDADCVLTNHDQIPLPPTLNPLFYEAAIPGGGVEQTEDGTDHEFSKLSCIISPEVSLTLHAKNFVLSELQLSFERRPSISFVILYHCWKSFLS
jgi:hypothetical protein